MRGLMVAVAAALVLAVRAGGAARVGDVVYRSDFDSAGALRAWGALPAGVAAEPGRQGGQCIRVERTGSMAGSLGVRMPLDLTAVRGCRLRLEAMIKAQDVAAPAHAWNGVKFMLHTKSASGERWEQRDSVWGSFDWRLVRFDVDLAPDATEASLTLGLEETTGKAWFDDVRVTVTALPRVHRTGAVDLSHLYTGHKVERLRGAMIGMGVGAADLREFGRVWKANHVRWQLTWDGFPRSPADNGDLVAYDAWLDGQLKRLDDLLPVCREAGIQPLIDLHTPPGGRDSANVCNLFKEKRFQDKFLEIWRRIATRYRGNRTVWGYDLVNEPVEGDVPDGVDDWHALALRAAKLVRSIDPDHAIIVEPAPWGSPDGLARFEPLPVKGIVYSVHMYMPHTFTHQGVNGSKVGVVYPGMIDGKMWNKEAVRAALQPVLDFQRDFGVQIYIGEFSAIRWAPADSARRYLSDLIDIMEEYHWDWAYHAFREWDGWSVEHGSDPADHNRASSPTGREQLLRAWFARNRPAR